MVQTEYVTFQRVKGKRGWCRTEAGEHSNVSERKKVPARRTVAEDKAKLNATSFCCSVCSLLSLVRDRALSRKAFSYFGLCLFLTAQRPHWHNQLVAENSSLSIPGQLSVRVWVPHPQEPPTSSSVTLQMLSLFMWLCHEKCRQLLLTCVKWFYSHLCMDDDFWIYNCCPALFALHAFYIILAVVFSLRHLISIDSNGNI